MKNPPYEVGTDAPILQMGKLRLRGWTRNTSFWDLNPILPEGEAPFLIFRKEEPPPAKLLRKVLLCYLPGKEALSVMRGSLETQRSWGQLQCSTISDHRGTGSVSSDPKKMLIGRG